MLTGTKLVYLRRQLHNIILMKQYFSIKRVHCRQIHFIVFVASVFVALAQQCYADNRSFVQAQQIATRKALSLGANIGETQLQQAKRFQQSRRKTEAADSIPYYIFNFDNQKGYAIVGGDDNMPEIVGYSTNGQLSTDNMPENMKYFLKAYEQTVKAVRRGDESAVENVRAAMKRQKGSFTPVEPLLGDIEWSQEQPYNNLCPAYFDNIPSVTGCVATAMAQIMRYWKYPSALQNDIPAYTTYSYKINVPAISSGTVYDWDNMIPSYLGNYDDTQASAVATLMYHVGAALKMDYGPSSAAGLVPSVLSNYFGYDSDIIKDLMRNDFQWGDWNRILQNELANRRPVLYGGSSGYEAHAFVCDGIDSDGYYHINWGWDGLCNDYFDITILNPQYPRGEADEDNTYYANSNEMVVGIVPADAADKQPTFAYDNLFCSGFSFTVDSYTRSSKDECFSGTATFFLSNKGKEKERLFSVGLKTSEGDLIPIATEYATLNIPNLQTTEQTEVTLNYSYAIPHGEYDICAIESADDGETWELCNGSGTHFYVTDTQWIAKDKRYTEFVSDGLQYQWDCYEDEVYPYMSGFDVKGDVVIPSSVAYNGKTYPITKIGDYCFLQNNYITSVVVPEGVTELGSYCFAACPELVNVKLPSTLREIGEWAFGASDKLTEVIVPEGVEEIKDHTFQHCDNLAKVSLPQSIKTIGDYVFQNCDNLKRLDIPEGTKEMGKMCITYCDSLQEITLPSTLQKMGEGCFAENPELVKVTIPDNNKNITSLPKSCFSDCVKLESINIPSSVRELGAQCFNYCQSLKGTITIPEGVEEIPSTCFSFCYSLEGINIPSSVRKLGKQCFMECVNLKGAITIPEGVEEIPDGCFKDCHSLEEINIPQTVNKIGEDCFGDSGLNGTLTIPEGVTKLPRKCLSYCHKLQKIILPSTIEEIDSTSLYVNGAKEVILKATNVPAGFHSAFSQWSNYVELQDDGTWKFVGRKFDEQPMSQATLYVPDESVDAYKAEVGDMFNAVQPLSASGINAVSMSGCSVSVNGSNITFSGLSSGTIIKTYSIDGRLLAVCTVASNGVATCSCSEPIVIAKIGNNTLKIKTGR